MNLEHLSAVEAARRIRSGALSPLEYVQGLLSHVDAVEPRVQAWATIDREAVLSEAKQMEQEARKGQFRGPLHGVPVGIKDIFYTKNLRTTIGSPVFSDFVPTYDASAVQKLRQAGALIMGKCVTTVLIFYDPGPTRNPWNTSHTPGGSSSGSAAAVAAGMCPLSIGSQTVGSVGRPGAYNGVVSLMATQSRVRMAGAFPLAWSLDHMGLFTRSVEDMAVLLDAVSESPQPAQASHAAQTQSSNSGNRRFRVGVIRKFFYEKAEPESRTALDALTAKLANAGFTVDEAPLPGIFDLHPAILRTIVRSEAAAAHQDLILEHPEAYGPNLKSLVQMGHLIDAATYLRARRIRRHYEKEMTRLFERFDALLTPGAQGPAPAGMATGDPLMQAPWTLADFPTLTLPYALSANGMPLGAQLSAAPLHEGLLLEAAKAMESVIGFTAKPALNSNTP